MTSSAEPEGRLFTFVDAEKGALSLLAAGVARSLGLRAVAASLSPSADPPSEVAQVLEEVGMRVPEEGASLFNASDAASSELIFVGKEPPPALAAKPAWDLALYAGTGDLERMATARIVRDQIERRLEKA